MSLGFWNNLLIGPIPDALGLMVFGFAMIGTSFALRRITGTRAFANPQEAAGEEDNRELGQ